VSRRRWRVSRKPWLASTRNPRLLTRELHSGSARECYPGGVSSKFKFIDLCAGIGGLRIPFDGKIGPYQFMGEKVSTLQGECVFTAEIDRAARETYAEYFYGNQNEATLELLKNDLNDLRREIPDHDLLVAGFPCQPFSHAGLRKGFEDDRGNIFKRILDVIESKRPRVVLLENVKGLQTLKNHDGTSALNVILEDLRHPNRSGDYPSKHEDREDVRYFVAKPKVLNARDFGLPQNRNRLFIVAIRSDVAAVHSLVEDTDFIWPENTVDRETLEVKKFLDINVPESFTISDRLWDGHQQRKARNVSAGKGWGYQIFKPSAKYVATISARYFKDGSEALIDQGSSNPRKLTPNEARKLQGFPDDFYLHPSKMQAFRQFGNAVAVPVVSEIAKCLKPYLY
jgi:DNA (cytosine-5)-methyltransferase 1